MNGEAPACQPPTRSPSPHRVRMAVAEVQMRAAGGPCARRGMLDAGARSRHDVVGTHRSKERLSAAAQRCRAGLVVVSLKDVRLQTDRHCYLERRLWLARASAAQNRAVRIIQEVAGTHRSSRRTIRPRAPLRSGAPRTTSRPPRPRSRAASVATMRRRQRHPSAAVPAPPAPRASPGPARPRR